MAADKELTGYSVPQRGRVWTSRGGGRPAMADPLAKFRVRFRRLASRNRNDQGADADTANPS
jgi:hypothetical protein